jgi:hypothetical protein
MDVSAIAALHRPLEPDAPNLLANETEDHAGTLLPDPCGQTADARSQS